MEIPGSGVVNRYIASQGPLSTTSGDFWHMVWEQQSTLVVMLTTVVEQGRIKCHRYWPRLYESVEYGAMKIMCNKEQETPGFAFREFTLTNTQVSSALNLWMYLDSLIFPLANELSISVTGIRRRAIKKNNTTLECLITTKEESFLLKAHWPKKGNLNRKNVLQKLFFVWLERNLRDLS